MWTIIKLASNSIILALTNVYNAMFRIKDSKEDLIAYDSETVSENV